MHHHFSTNYYAYRSLQTGPCASANLVSNSVTEESPTTELINLIVMGMMVAAPLFGAAAGALCYMLFGATTEPLSIPLLGQTHVVSRVGLGAFSGLLVSVALGVISIVCMVTLSLLNALIRRLRR